MQQATLADDSCGAFGAPTTVGGTSYGVANGNCYRFTITATDNVGNVATRQTTVKVDTTAPVAPTIAFTRRLGREHVRERDDALLPRRPPAARSR